MENNYSSFKNFLKDKKNLRFLGFVVILISIPITVLMVGQVLDTRSKATSDILEAEMSSVITGKYSIGEDSNASGGKYIHFGVSQPTASPTKKPSSIPTKTPTRTPTNTPTSKPLSTTVDSSQACSGFTGSNIPSNGNYKATAFGCVNGWSDPNDNCIGACGNPPGLCNGLSGPECERKIGWFAADADRYGCFSRLKVTNPKTGKAAVVIVLDRGPSCSAEQSARGPIFDMSYTAAKYVGGSNGGNYETVHVEKVSSGTPLGPIN